jgi:Protein of unknown function (DUF3014)
MPENQEETPEEIGEDLISEGSRKSDRRVVLMAAGILLVLVAAFAFYYFAIYKNPSRSDEAPGAPLAEQKQLAPAEPSDGAAVPPVALDQSDDLVRRLAREISSHPRLASWLKSEQLVRHFVGAVDNIANGLSPRSHITFFMPDGEFKVIKTGNLFVADPDGFARYNPVVDVFVSVDTAQCVSLLRGLKPLCQEAYRDLGYPGQDFEATLARAISELLATPVVEGDIILEKAVLNYTMLDPNLENLSDAQKHLLRMGPENVEAIQKKLRELAAALGVPASSLPVSRRYTT